MPDGNAANLVFTIIIGGLTVVLLVLTLREDLLKFRGR